MSDSTLTRLQTLSWRQQMRCIAGSREAGLQGQRFGTIAHRACANAKHVLATRLVLLQVDGKACSAQLLRQPFCVVARGKDADLKPPVATSGSASAATAGGAVAGSSGGASGAGAAGAGARVSAESFKVMLKVRSGGPASADCAGAMTSVCGSGPENISGTMTITAATKISAPVRRSLTEASTP
jgi:hypothetical protein